MSNKLSRTKKEETIINRKSFDKGRLIFYLGLKIFFFPFSLVLLNAHITIQANEALERGRKDSQRFGFDCIVGRYGTHCMNR